MVLAGACQAVVTVVMFTIVQTRAPAGARGRVLALYTLAIFGVMPLSFAAASLVGDALGSPAIVVFGAASMVACGLLALGRREMRALP